MGMKKIEEKRKELVARRVSYEEFVAVVDKLRDQLEVIQKAGLAAKKAVADYEEQKKRLLPSVKRLDDLGIKEFSDYRASLEAICTDMAFRDMPLPLTPLKKVVDRAEDEMKKMLDEWLEKQSASIPKEFKKGMSFKDYTMGRVYELTTDEYKAANSNLPGDAGQWFDFKFTEIDSGKTGNGKMSKAMLLKNKVKFLKL